MSSNNSAIDVSDDDEKGKQPSSMIERLEEDVVTLTASAPTTTLRLSTEKKKVRHRFVPGKQSLSNSEKHASDDNDGVPPGAVPVQGMNNHFSEQTQGEEAASTTMSQHPLVESTQAVLTAQVVPDSEEIMAAMLANQLEMQIKEAIRAHMSQDRQNIVLAEPAGTSEPSNQHDNNPTNVASKRFGGLPQQRAVWIFILISVVVIIALVGTVSGIMLTSPQGTAPVRSIDVAPTVGWREELEPLIIRTEMDRLLFDDIDSPQSHALQWLSNDTYQLSLSGTISIKEKVERYALAVLYYSTNGSNWLHQDFPFLSATSACDWNNGLQLDDDNARGVFCLDSSILSFLILNNNNLVGTLPWELSLLPDLVFFFFNDNHLAGTIPTELSALSKLESVNVMSNKLSGPLPGLLPSTMRVINLSENSLSGMIPVAWGTRLSNLEFLMVLDNYLWGPIPSEIGMLTSLKILWLTENGWTGTIPTEFGQLSSLEQAWIGQSKLSGQIPTQLGNLENLTELGIFENSLTGPIPTEIGKLTKLDSLYLYDNVLTGTVPTEMGKLSMLETVYLNDNALTGTLPTELAQLARLQMFNVSINNMLGSFDDILCSIPGVFIASDCFGNGTVGESKIDCSCCTECCSADGSLCVDMEQGPA